MLRDFPVIDYERHPAFASLSSSISKPNPKLSRLIEEADSAYEKLLGSSIDGNIRLEHFNQQIAPKLDAVCRLAADGINAEFMPYANAALARARKELQENVILRRRAVPANNEIAAASANELAMLQTLTERGIVTPEPDEDLARRVWRWTFMERAIVREKSRKNPHNRATFSIIPSSPAWRAVDNHLRENGCMGAASIYLGAPLALTGIGLEYSHPGQNWYRNCYKDAGIPTAKSAYMHLDADSDIIKVVLYLSDVGSRNGPFHFIPGSNRWKRSHVGIAVQNSFDQLSSKYLGGGGAQYYRPRFQISRNRRNMLGLPREFWGSTHFGDDLIDGSELANDLLGQEVMYTGQKGTMVMFDGSHGIHRGGMVQEGGRWVVQIMLMKQRAKSDAPSPVLHPNLVFAKHCIGNVVRFARMRLA